MDYKDFKFGKSDEHFIMQQMRYAMDKQHVWNVCEAWYEGFKSQLEKDGYVIVKRSEIPEKVSKE